MYKNQLKILLFGVLLSFSGLSNAQMVRDNFSITQKSDDGVLVAYPNPARDVLVVKSKDTSVKIKSVTFYSILGVQVASYNLNGNSSEINIEKLRPGKYLMRYILSDDTQKVTQIIKQ